MAQNKIAVILGSARSDGNTRKLVDQLSFKKNTKVFDLNQYNISYFDYHHLNEKDDFIPLIEELLSFDTYLFATPVYWYTMSAPMKTFFDRLTDLLTIRKDLGRQLKGKSMAVLACSSDATEYPEFWSPFTRSAEYLHMHYLGQIHGWVENKSVPDTLKPDLFQFAEKLKVGHK